MDNSVGMENQQAVDSRTVAAFTRLFDDHYNRVVRFVARRVNNQADAADLAAETFRRAWERCQRGEEVPSPAWLFATAHNTVGDLYRARERGAKVQVSVLEHVDVASSSDGAEGVYETLESLTTADQELLRLRYWDDLSIAEISCLLATPAATLWVRLHRARRRFAEHYTQIEKRRRP